MLVVYTRGHMSHGKIVIGGIVAVVVLFVVFGIWNRTQPGEYDMLAQCIADSDATFYGAYWCPHCQEQKAMFGRSADLLPYKECSTPNGQDQIAECDEADVTGYPTWVFADGSRLEGTHPLETLAERTNCALPQ